MRTVKPDIVDCAYPEFKPDGYVKVPKGSVSWRTYMECPKLCRFIEINVSEIAGKGICVCKECQNIPNP